MTERVTPTGRVLRLETEVPVDAGAAWRMLTDAEELRRWFPLDARVEPGVGGEIFVSWGPGVEGAAPIVAWEPGVRVAWREGELLVEFTVETRAGGGAVVRLAQSGFGDDENWDRYYDSLHDGWTAFLFHLRHCLTHHAGESRALAWARAKSPLSHAAAWSALTAGGGPLRLAGGMPSPGDRWTLALPGEPPQDGVVVFARPGRCFVGTLPDLDRSVLFVELEGSDPDWHLGVWLSTWGAGRVHAPRLQAAVERAVAAAFAGGG